MVQPVTPCSIAGKPQRRLVSPLVHVTHSFSALQDGGQIVLGRYLRRPPLGLAVRHGRLPQPQALPRQDVN